MPLNMIKLCVGVNDIDQLARSQAQRLKQNKQIYHVTRMVPKRASELLDGGSLYWVIRGVVLVRQQLTDIVVFNDEEGTRRCRLMLEPNLVPVRPLPRRAFQGWRYFTEQDAPPDLSKSAQDSDIPVQMRTELIELGLL